MSLAGDDSSSYWIKVNNDIILIEGNIGIGTETPIHKLDVVGNCNIEGEIYIGTPGTANDLYIGANEIKLRNSGNAHFSIFNQNERFYINNTGGGGNLGVTGINLFTITESGLVGIGITNPLSNLHIYEDNTTINQLRLENPNSNGSAGISLHNGADEFRIELDNTDNRTTLYNGLGGMDYVAVEGDHIFYKGWSGSQTEQMRIKNNGIIDILGQLSLTSTTDAFSPNLLTTTQRNALSPIAGNTIYNTTVNKLQCYNGTIWNDCF